MMDAADARILGRAIVFVLATITGSALLGVMVRVFVATSGLGG